MTAVVARVAELEPDPELLSGKVRSIPLPRFPWLYMYAVDSSVIQRKLLTNSVNSVAAYFSGSAFPKRFLLLISLTVHAKFKSKLKIHLIAGKR